MQKTGEILDQAKEVAGYGRRRQTGTRMLTFRRRNVSHCFSAAILVKHSVESTLSRTQQTHCRLANSFPTMSQRKRQPKCSLSGEAVITGRETPDIANHKLIPSYFFLLERWKSIFVYIFSHHSPGIPF